MTLVSPDVAPVPKAPEPKPKLKAATPLKESLAEVAKGKAKPEEEVAEPEELFDSRAFLSTTPDNTRRTLEVLATQGNISKMFEKTGKEIREAPDATDHDKALGYDMEIAGTTDRLMTLSAKQRKSRFKDAKREKQIEELAKSVDKLKKEREELSKKNNTVKANQLEPVAALLGADAKASGENPYRAIKNILTEAASSSEKQAKLINMLKVTAESGEFAGLDSSTVDQLDDTLSDNRSAERKKKIGKVGLGVAGLMALASTILAWFAAKASRADNAGRR